MINMENSNNSFTRREAYDFLLREEARNSITGDEINSLENKCDQITEEKIRELKDLFTVTFDDEKQ